MVPDFLGDDFHFAVYGVNMIYEVIICSITLLYLTQGVTYTTSILLYKLAIVIPRLFSWFFLQ